MGSFQRFVRRMILFQKRSSLISDWKKYVLFDLLTPILQMLCYSLIAFYAYGNDHVQKWMIGNAILISAFGSLYGVGVQILVEKRTGTLSLLIASKTKLHEIFLASTISTVLNSFLSVIIGISVVSLIFRIAWSFDLIFALLQVLIIAVFVSMSFGFIFSCFILLTSEINLILNTVSRILLIFSGANFPIEDLPIFFIITSDKID